MHTEGHEYDPELSYEENFDLGNVHTDAAPAEYDCWGNPVGEEE